MSTFMMFGKYSAESLKGISSERTKKAIEVIQNSEGKVISIYALMGEYDLVLALDFPDVERAIKASVELNKITGISFTTSPAIDVEQFDRLIS